MNNTSLPLALVVIAGPQASGKSATAAALSAALRSAGESVALVELDQIASMALPSLPSWDTVHEIAESVTAQWARSGVTCVVSEGVGNQEQVRRLLAQAPSTAVTLTVVTTSPFEVALARAQADPTRGISRDPTFLSAVYEQWAVEVGRIDADVLLDTSVGSVEQGTQRICDAIDLARHALETGGKRG